MKFKQRGGHWKRRTRVFPQPVTMLKTHNSQVSDTHLIRFERYFFNVIRVNDSEEEEKLNMGLKNTTHFLPRELIYVFKVIELVGMLPFRVPL